MRKKKPVPIVESIPISKISVRSGWNSRSGDDKDFLDVLKDSIKRNGMKHPILVVRKGKRFEVIEGLRRLKVAKAMGRKTIRAQVEAFENRDMERLAYIDLNVVRRTLSAYDLSQFLVEKEEIYQRQFPSSRPGISQVIGMHKKLGNKIDVGDDVTPTSFPEYVEKTGGPKKRTTQRLVAVGKNLSPKSKKSFKKGELTQSQAYLLTGLDNDLQDQVVGAIKDLNTKDSKKYIKQVQQSGKVKKLHTIKNHKGEYLEVNSWMESCISGLHIMDNVIQAITEQKPLGKVKAEIRKEFEEAFIDHRRIVNKLYSDLYTRTRTRSKKGNVSEMVG